MGGEGRTLGKGEGSPYNPRYLQEGDGRRKNMLGGQGTSGKEGSVTLPGRLARETTRSKIHKGGDFWPGAPRDMLFLTYIHMWRSNIYVFLTQKDQNPHRSSDSWPPWENQKPWPLWVPSPAQNRGRVEGAFQDAVHLPPAPLTPSLILPARWAPVFVTQPTANPISPFYRQEGRGPENQEKPQDSTQRLSASAPSQP